MLTSTEIKSMALGLGVDKCGIAADMIVQEW
jgi:hypothetical protein